MPTISICVIPCGAGSRPRPPHPREPVPSVPPVGEADGSLLRYGGFRAAPYAHHEGHIFRRTSDLLTGRRVGLKLILLAPLILGFLAQVSCQKKTDQDLILEMLKNIGRLAEKKDLEAIMANFTADFRDFEGRDKPGLRALLQDYFSGRTGIVVHLLSSRFDSLETTRASLETEVALSAGGAEALRRLIRISPDNYRIKIDLGKNEERWLIQYAEWSYVSLNELFPESLSILKKIFPRL